MGLKKLLTSLEKGEKVDQALEAYPRHKNAAGSGPGNANYGNSYTPVFEGVFRQKSYKFGEGTAFDKPGGSFSRQPYLMVGSNQTGILGSIGQGIEGVSDAIGDFGTQLSDAGVDNYTDGFIRGGLGTVLKRSADDMLRLGKWMLDGPKGPMWILKQVGLQRSNPRLQEFPDTTMGKAEAFIGRNRVYNLGINTLAQPLVNAFGIHVTRQGLLPLGRPNYGWDMGINIFNKSKYAYNAKEMGDKTDDDFEKGFIGRKPLSLFHNRLRSLLTNIGDDIGTALYTYSGGPNSLYGIGRTTIQKYEKTQNAGYKPLNDPHKVSSRNYSTTPRHTGKANGPKPNSVLNIIDFRKNRGVPYTDYASETSGSGDDKMITPKFARESNYGLGNPGFSVRQKAYNTIDAKLVDNINALPILKTNAELPKQFEHNGKRIKDFIPFRFECVNSDDPTESNVIIFRAYLENFGDKYSGKWKRYNYNGRAENFYTYDSFDRKINFKFKIAAQSRSEMMPLYTKLNYLVSNTAPEYGGAHGDRMRGTFMKLTIGDMIHRTPGILTSVGVTWKSTYPWEIALDQEGKDADMLQLPQILDVNCSFTPIHNFIPQRSVMNSPFILPHKFNGRVPSTSDFLGDSSKVINNWDDPNAEDDDAWNYSGNTGDGGDDDDAAMHNSINSAGDKRYSAKDMGGCGCWEDI